MQSLSQATPHMSSKRKSLYGRKLRPQSVVDSTEGLSADDIPDLLPKSAEESQDSVSDLPSSGSSQVLMHLVKSRPRRHKTRQPTRPMLRGTNPEAEQASAKDAAAIAEGLDTFFVKPTPPQNNGLVSLFSRTDQSLEYLFIFTLSQAKIRILNNSHYFAFKLMYFQGY